MKPDLFKLVELKEKIEEDLQKKVDIMRNHKYMKPFLLKNAREGYRLCLINN